MFIKLVIGDWHHLGCLMKYFFISLSIELLEVGGTANKQAALLSLTLSDRETPSFEYPWNSLVLFSILIFLVGVKFTRMHVGECDQPFLRRSD